MKIIALLSWYQEPPSWLSATVASLAGIADHLVAVDGAYALVASSLAAPRSGREQVEAIAATAAGCGLGYTIHTRSDPWYGNEIEKRSFLFAAGALVAAGEDWYLVIDGDETVARAPGDLRAQLATLRNDVAHVDYFERSADPPPPGQPSPHRYLPLQDAGSARRFFRALPGLTVEGNHYTYRAGDGRYLWGNPDQVELAPADRIRCFALEHWHRFRQPARQKLATDYYHVRDQLGVETPQQALDARRAAGWSSPLQPLTDGQLLCLLDQRGFYEWLATPTDARRYLAEGIVVNGARLQVEKITELPLMNAWQIQARTDHVPAGFLEAAAT